MKLECLLQGIIEINRVDNRFSERFGILSVQLYDYVLIDRFPRSIHCALENKALERFTLKARSALKRLLGFGTQGQPELLLFVCSNPAHWLSSSQSLHLLYIKKMPVSWTLCDIAIWNGGVGRRASGCLRFSHYATRRVIRLIRQNLDFP